MRSRDRSKISCPDSKMTKRGIVNRESRSVTPEGLPSCFCSASGINLTLAIFYLSISKLTLTHPTLRTRDVPGDVLTYTTTIGTVGAGSALLTPRAGRTQQSKLDLSIMNSCTSYNGMPRF